MWRAVPQIPVRSMRMSTSLRPHLGSGTSTGQRPGCALRLMRAFMERAWDASGETTEQANKTGVYDTAQNFVRDANVGHRVLAGFRSNAKALGCRPSTINSAADGAHAAS